MSKNSKFDSLPLRVRRRRLFFIRFYIVLFFLLVIVFGLAILSGHEKVRVENIVVSGNAVVPTDDILSIAHRDMAGRYLYLFSRSNSLIFPRFQIKGDLLKEIKIIKDVDISWKGWQTVAIKVSERKPHSVWCGDDPRAPEAGCFFVDKEGYIYSQAPFFSGNVYIKDYGNISTSTNPLGQYFLLPAVYSQIFNLIGALDQYNLKVSAVSFDGYDFRFVLETGPEIIFNDKNRFDSSLGNLFMALETKSLDLVKDAGTISYIDLRFDSKIVVGKKGI